MERCTGFWEMCECEDCRKVAVLYADLAWLEEMDPYNKGEIQQIIQEIEDMGYSV